MKFLYSILFGGVKNYKRLKENEKKRGGEDKEKITLLGILTSFPIRENQRANICENDFLIAGKNK